MINDVIKSMNNYCQRTRVLMYISFKQSCFGAN